MGVGEKTRPGNTFGQDRGVLNTKLSLHFVLWAEEVPYSFAILENTLGGMWGGKGLTQESDFGVLEICSINGVLA